MDQPRLLIPAEAYAAKYGGEAIADRNRETRRLPQEPGPIGDLADAMPSIVASS
jgi:hypothetical protein